MGGKAARIGPDAAAMLIRREQDNESDAKAVAPAKCTCNIPGSPDDVGYTCSKRDKSGACTGNNKVCIPPAGWQDGKTWDYPSGGNMQNICREGALVYAGYASLSMPVGQGGAQLRSEADPMAFLDAKCSDKFGQYSRVALNTEISGNRVHGKPANPQAVFPTNNPTTTWGLVVGCRTKAECEASSTGWGMSVRGTNAQAWPATTAQFASCTDCGFALCVNVGDIADIANTRGDQGPQGDAGQPGQTGPKGAVGPQGDKGPEGAEGAAGEAGEQGEKGDTG